MNIKVLDFIQNKWRVKKYYVGSCIYAIDLGDKTKVGQTGLVYERLITHLRNYKKEHGEPKKFRVAISCGVTCIGMVEASILKHFEEYRINNTEVLAKGFDEVVAFIDSFIEAGKLDRHNRTFQKFGLNALNKILDCGEPVISPVANLLDYNSYLHSLRRMNH